MSRLSLKLACVASLLVSGPAAAATVTQTADIGLTFSLLESVLFAKYSGPGTITAVNFAFEGETAQFKDVSGGDEPFVRPAEDVSWTIYLLGPGVDAGGGSTTYDEIGSYLVNTQYPETLVTAPAGELQTLITPVIPFTINGSDSNFGRYVGAGFNEFQVSAEFAGVGTSFRGTLTQTITLTGVPEPATWALLIMGFGLTGAALRRRAQGPVNLRRVRVRPSES